MDAFFESSGKYFFIKCKTHEDMVLDVSGGKTAPGTPVILYHKKSPVTDNQLWCYNAAKKAIFTKIGNLCIDVDGKGHIVINPPKGSDTQQWMFKGDIIVRVSNPKKAIDINEAKYEDHNKVLQWDLHNKHNQQFVLEFQPPKLFYIKSSEHGRVLDVEGANKAAGTKCILWQKKPINDASNQLFYEDHLGLIRSNYTNFVLEHHGDNVMTFKKYEPGNPKQRWCFHDNHIVNANKTNEVLSGDLKVKEKSDSNKEQWVPEYV